MVAVKDWSNDIVAYEKNLRALRASGRPVAMLSSFTDVAHGELPARRRRLHLGHGQRSRRPPGRALRRRQGRATSASARALNDRLAPLVSVFYAPPFVDMHNRMKEALALLGRIPAAHVRPPLTPVSDDERHRIRLALREARLTRDGAAR